MTHDNGEEALSLITTAKGNHTRNLSNLREFESLRKIGWEANCDTGYVVPYNNQINLSQKHMSENMMAISRAKNKFTLVTGYNVFTKNNKTELTKRQKAF